MLLIEGAAVEQPIISPRGVPIHPSLIDIAGQILGLIVRGRTNRQRHAQSKAHNAQAKNLPCPHISAPCRKQFATDPGTTIYYRRGRNILFGRNCGGPPEAVCATKCQLRVGPSGLPARSVYQASGSVAATTQALMEKVCSPRLRRLRGWVPLWLTPAFSFRAEAHPNGRSQPVPVGS